MGAFVIYIMGIIGRHFRSASICHIFFYGLPVDGCDEIFVILRCIHLQQCVCFFSIIRGEEEPTMGIPPSRTGKVVIEPWHDYLELNVHVTMLGIHTYKCQGTFEVSLVFANGNVALWNRNSKSRTGNYIFRVFSNEGRTVIPRTVRYLDDLFGLKCTQADTAYTWGVIPIDKNPAPVQFAIGLRNIRVVQIIPGDKAM